MPLIADTTDGVPTYDWRLCSNGRCHSVSEELVLSAVNALGGRLATFVRRFGGRQSRTSLPILSRQDSVCSEQFGGKAQENGSRAKSDSSTFASSCLNSMKEFEPAKHSCGGR